jgi:hypothetical protein
MLALYKREGERSLRARQTFKTIVAADGNVLVVPWPVLYERLNSEFSGRRDWLKRFNSDWGSLERSRKLEYVDDSPFRKICRDELLGELPERSGRFPGLSLVDRILMALIEDRSKNIEALLTFDLRDFRGFCTKRRIEILPGA